MEENYFPVQGFYFTVQFNGINTVIDNAFQEISGIGVKQQTEEIKAGGINNRQYKVPTRTSYDNLVLKRGHLKVGTDLSKWIDDQLLNNYSSYITPKNITVQLMDVNNSDPLMNWYFENAYPIGWSISSLDASSSKILIETLEFTYTYMLKTTVNDL